VSRGEEKRRNDLLKKILPTAGSLAIAREVLEESFYVESSALTLLEKRAEDIQSA